MDSSVSRYWLNKTYFIANLETHSSISESLAHYID